MQKNKEKATTKLRVPNHKDDTTLNRPKRMTIERKHRGHFAISVLGGHLVRRFADQFYYSQACEALAVHRYTNQFEFVSFFKSLPNGFTAFGEIEMPRKASPAREGFKWAST